MWSAVAEREAAAERTRVAALPEILVLEAHMVTNPDGKVIAAVIEGAFEKVVGACPSPARLVHLTTGSDAIACGTMPLLTNV